MVWTRMDSRVETVGKQDSQTLWTRAVSAYKVLSNPTACFEMNHQEQNLITKMQMQPIKSKLT